MATTARGYPYPTGEDLVIDGDNALKALADYLDVLPQLAWEVHGSGVVVADAASGASVALPVTVGDVAEQSGHFTNAAGVLTYSGPDYWFLASGGVSIEPAPSGDAGGRVLKLVRNSTILVAQQVRPLVGIDTTLNVSHAFALTDGDEISLVALQTSGDAIDLRGPAAFTLLGVTPV